MLHIKSNDYWAFLDEIEAPMWVDLTLEGKTYNQNIDDKWFYTHHSVHQSSSHDLKLAFSQLFEEGKRLDFELSMSSSLSLPNSVSRSRGKDFDDRKRKGSRQGFAMDKHIVGEKLLLNPSLVPYASGFTENVMPNDSVIGLSSGGQEPVNSRTSNTIIDGIGHRQQHKPTEVMSQPLSSSSKLLSDMRRSFRKSCAIRQASRLEVNTFQKQSSGYNSSLSNSSISSSLNPGFGAKSITKTSEHSLKSSVGSFSRMTHASMKKSKVSGVFSNTLKIQVEDASSNSRRIDKHKLYNAKPTHRESAKPKILRPKASLLQQRDDRNSCLKLKKKEGLDGTGRCKTAVAGKENAIGRIAVSQKCNGKVPYTFSMVKDQKQTQHKVPQRIGGQSELEAAG